MLVGAVMGFWTVQRVHATTGVALAARGRRRRARRRGDGRDPRLPRDHAAREPDRLRARADDLRRRGRAFVVPRQRPEPRRPAGRHTFSAVFPDAMQHWPIVGPIVFGQNVLVYVSWVCVVAHRALPVTHAPGPQRPRRRRVAGGRRHDGDQRHALPLRPHARRRRVRRHRRARRSRSRSRRSGWTGSPAAPAGSRSRSSSSRSGGRSSASSAPTSSARSRRSRRSCRRATSASGRRCSGRTRCRT